MRFFAIDGLAAAGARQAVAPLRRLYRRVSAIVRENRAVALSGDAARFLAAQSQRVAAVRALANLDPAGALDELLDAARLRTYPRDSALSLRLNEGAYELRRLAITGLGYSRSAAATRYLLDGGAVGDRDFRIRASAVRALGVLGEVAALNALVAALEDPSAEVRWIAATVLGRMGDRRAGDSLLSALSDPHPRVRRQAVLSLGYLRVRPAMRQIAALAEGDDSEAVRAAARSVLGLLSRDGH